MIIIDCGSGNTCKNDINTALEMVKEIADLKDYIKDDIVIKWQLFKKAGDNVPLDIEVFDRARKYAALYGLRTSASVFDKESLNFAMKSGVPFIKIANSQASRDIIKLVPDDMPIVQSIDKLEMPLGSRENLSFIYCISDYPAKKEDYIKKFGDKLKTGISDHTDNFDLYKKYKPEVYEFHYKLKDSTGLDAGIFARTFKQVQEAFK